MKTIIAGTRDFDDYEAMRNVLRGEHLRITEVVSGTASGADALGEQWAEEHGILITKFRADWKKHGKAAGPIRNAEMAAYADYLFLFWDGKSRGSASMLREMKKINKPYCTYIFMRKRTG